MLFIREKYFKPGDLWRDGGFTLGDQTWAFKDDFSLDDL